METEEEVLPPVEVEFDDTSIQELIEVLKEEQEIKKMELEANEEEALQDSEVVEDIEVRLQTLEENYSLLMDNLTVQFSTMNTSILEVSEKVETNNDLVAENSMVIMLSVAVALAVYNFVNQISKW